MQMEMTETYRVVIEQDGSASFGSVIDLFADYDYPQILCYGASVAGEPVQMTLEFMFYDMALEFATYWFGERLGKLDEDVTQYVQTISQHTP